MWSYEKKLQHPVKIKNSDPAMAKIIIAQLGGPDGEMGAATRYLNQRYAMPYDEAKAILTDIGMSVVVEVLPFASSQPRSFGKTAFPLARRAVYSAPCARKHRTRWPLPRSVTGGFSREQCSCA